MSGSKAVFLAALLVAAGLIHCSLGSHQCIQMSDCERGYMCVEGTCETNESLTPATADDAGTAPDQ